MCYTRKQEEMRKKRGRILETAECLDKGMDTKQIAEELGVSRRTVQRYVRYIQDNQWIIVKS